VDIQSDSLQQYTTVKVKPTEKVVDSRGVVRGAGTKIKKLIKKSEVKNEL